MYTKKIQHSLPLIKMFTARTLGDDKTGLTVVITTFFTEVVEIVAPQASAEDILDRVRPP